MSLQKRLVLVAVSAVSTWPILSFFSLGYASSFEEIIHYGLIGGLFGLLILVPFVTSKSYRAARFIGLIMCGILIYRVAIAALDISDLDDYYVIDSVVISGVIGAILVGNATKLIAPLHVSWKYWFYVPVAGFFGGLIFSLLLDVDSFLAGILAYGSWQILVCLAMHYGRVNDTSKESMEQAQALNWKRG